MGSTDRSKKRIHLLKKTAIHFLLCFVMGFFTGFAPYQPAKSLGISGTPIVALGSVVPEIAASNYDITPNRTLVDDNKDNGEDEDDDEEDDKKADSSSSNPEPLLIIITTTRAGDPLQEALLMRLGHTLRLVEPPLLWIVVEAHSEAPRTAGLLRRTGIMYRHLTFKENFTDHRAEADHQRNVALNHVEYHRLDGIVHFAGASNVYDLRFFDEIRDIEMFGAWPVAMVSSNRKRVVVEGPVCSSSKVNGWRWLDFSNTTSKSSSLDEKPSRINISGFAFNSSILWDPERWGRPTSSPDTSQDSIKFVEQVVLEDPTKLRAIPRDCSRIMTWYLHVPRSQILDRS